MAVPKAFWKEEAKEPAHRNIKKALEKEAGMKKDSKPKSKGKAKVQKVMGEYKEGSLHSGSKKGPQVKNRKQAIAIALSEARKAGAKIKKKK